MHKSKCPPRPTYVRQRSPMSPSRLFPSHPQPFPRRPSRLSPHTPGVQRKRPTRHCADSGTCVLRGSGEFLFKAGPLPYRSISGRCAVQSRARLPSRGGLEQWFCMCALPHNTEGRCSTRADAMRCVLVPETLVHASNPRTPNTWIISGRLPLWETRRVGCCLLKICLVSR